MSDIQARHDRLNQAILAGKGMDLFDELYADDITMQENTDAPCVGKKQNHEREAQFFAAVEQWYGAKLLSSAVAGDVSFSEWEFDVQFKGAPRAPMTQVSVRRWKNGQIVHERFYHK